MSTVRIAKIPRKVGDEPVSLSALAGPIGVDSNSRSANKPVGTRIDSMRIKFDIKGSLEASALGSEKGRSQKPLVAVSQIRDIGA
ncbi:MAG TPA: hypothetical protein VGF86_12295 [Candidatus Tumulicola sp.]